MGASMPGGGGNKAMMAEINVTPFVDVMLVLLVIFMVATPLIDKDEDKRKVDIDLPVTKQNANRIDPKNTDKMILEVTRDLEVRIGKEVITDCGGAKGKTAKDRFEVCFEEIERKLKANPKLQEERELYLLADTEIPYGFVVGTMARIKKAGVDKLGMVTNPEYLDEEPEPKGGKKGKKGK
jgi:biopolymer transport protein TolR